MHSNYRIVAALVFLTITLGTSAAAASSTTTDPSHIHRLPTVSADGYYSPNGNSVTWPVGPALF